MKISLLTWMQTTKLLILMNFKTWMLAAIWFALTKISDKLFDLFVSNIPSNIANLPTEASARGELKKLNDRASRIRARLDDAEQNRKIENESVLLWLSELRSIAFEAEDLNEEFEARVRAREASRWYCRGVKNQIDEINERYDAIFNDRERLREYNQAPVASPQTGLEGDAPINRETRRDETGSSEGAIQLRGRHEENKLLRRLLRQDSNSTRLPPVISIIGEGGIGKTALARSAYNHPDISEHFKPLIWISLSAKPDPVETIKKIIEVINGTNCNLSTLDMLQRTLQQLLRGKKFLLVLDGVFTDTNDMLFWDPIWIPLSMAESGSKVLATTRNQTTAQYMGSSDQVPLTGLNSDSLWLVLQDEAFPQGHVPENLARIGKEIAKKCYGSPLVAKLVGRTLYCRTEEERWKSLLQAMPNPDDVVGNVLPYLKRSYELLPLHLKRCFAYCSIFPKGYEFERDYLVKLWMSEGLLKSERRNARTLEDVGRKQFNDLLWRSFFQPCGQLGGCDRYVMPGAIHDLAESVSMNECARVDHSGIQHGKHTMARYAYLCGDHLKHESLKNIYEKEHLRTLIITGGPSSVINILQKKLSSNLKCLRSLDMSKCKVDNLHESIGNLIHLRYLNLSGSLLESLPESICKLLNLQTLNLDDCDNLKELPKGMCNLINMRHIFLSLNWEEWKGKDFDSMPPELGRLTSLQTLSRFAVAKQDGCGISELKDLKLIGDLCISNLEKVENGWDARDANLGNKVLRHLRLRWTDNSANEEEVIMQLRPSNAIKSICIDGYNGSNLPNWVTEPSFEHLEMLKIYNCKVCVDLPQIATMPQLKSLYLVGLDKVRDLKGLVGVTNSVAFSSLELLHLLDMPELEKWFVVPNGSLTKLRELSITDCPKLKQILHLPSSLMRFELRNCGALMPLPPTVPSLSKLVVEKVNSKIIGWVQNLTSLTSLALIKLPELRHITEGNLRRLRGLTMLKIDGCNELTSIARGPQDIPSLKKLEISFCEKLSLLCGQGLPDQIKELYLKGLKSLDKLPSRLDQLGHLHTLEICDVPKLQSVPKISSLELLSVEGCPELEKRCQNNGRDWDNVKHVRCLYIGGTTQPR
ncbi:NBS-LRR-like resistance protein [Rhynchospora pubera]|uniref:NBS-LRR-like resistance protein n=1 Tax=Rhynchospora pubera TaxID=906938 RepID=A0AAV8GN44_9POAL|nr:NBS-LRR-like resistance protein [Rhynchospora pubera]